MSRSKKPAAVAKRKLRGRRHRDPLPPVIKVPSSPEQVSDALDPIAKRDVTGEIKTILLDTEHQLSIALANVRAMLRRIK